MSKQGIKLFSLEKKVVLVTGASRGIGNTIACAMADSGAVVYGCGRTEIHRRPVMLFNYIQCDLSMTDLLLETIDNVYREHSRIDVLVNAAGISKSPRDQSLESKIRVFDETHRINARVPFITMSAVSNYMKENRGGSIINITSINAEFGFPDNPSYVSSKGALRALTKAFAEDLGSYGIRVNNIAPGYIHTRMTNKAFKNKKSYESRLRNTMLRRWGTPEDIVGAAIFLASDSSTYITGIDLEVDGGWAAKGMVED